jgi:alkylation response protein AidB-like acyl-CoA dehydrogenase
MDSTPAVTLSAYPPTSGEPAPLVALAGDSAPRGVADGLQTALALARFGALPGTGTTAALWEALATIASVDLGAVRAVEPHLDAVAILAQAPEGALPAVASAPECTWGVFAAEGGPFPLTATRTDTGNGNGTGNGTEAGSWTLTGTKPWCSLADRLSAALVTAHLGDGSRALFAVDLSDPGVRTDTGGWFARGLSEIPSGPVEFTAVPAYPVGEAQWYLDRPGFSWGGIGVAACWYGGAVGLARSVFAAARTRDAVDPLLAMHLGAIDEQLQTARRALAEAAELVDHGRISGAFGKQVTHRVRATVALACENILTRVGHALGPAPLAQDDTHSKRVADLQLYIRQHHAEKDQASLGSSLARTGVTPW